MTTSDEPERIGDWMQTFTGRQFWPLDPRAEDVDIQDIAVALSRQCRFAGHCEHYYSVAQHSWYVSFFVPPEHALCALLHDATEAYCVDVPRPLKKSLPDYCAIEDRIWRAIAQRFNLPAEMPECVKEADDRVLMAEKAQILKDGKPWAVRAHPAPIRIEEWTPQRASFTFLERFNELVAGSDVLKKLRVF